MAPLLGHAHEGRSVTICLPETDLPWSSRNPDRAEKIDFLLYRTRQTSACHCSSPSGLLTNCGAQSSTLPESLTSVRRMSACHCGSPSGLPTNRDAQFSILFESLTSLTVHLRAYLCSSAYPRKPWEQKKFDKNLMGTKRILIGIFWVLDGNKRNFFGTWWEQDEFDENRKNLITNWWEQKNFDGNKRYLMGNLWKLDENKMLMGY